MTTGTGPPITIIDSATKGAPTALIRRADGSEAYLHSRFDPVEEARLLIGDVPLRERTMYLVLGFGLGYHVKELLNRIPHTSHVTVAEPRGACLSALRPPGGKNRAATWMKSPRLHFLTLDEPGLGPIYLADRLAEMRLLGIELFTHLPSTLMDETFYRNLSAEVRQKFPRSFAVHLSSLDKLLENDLANFWANLSCSWNAAPAQCLRRKWSGRPLVIVSAGPSLDSAVLSLREVRGRAMLLATGTAARILMERDIRPDLVISLDPYDTNLAHFQGWGASGVPLVYYHRINRRVLDLHSGPRFVFIMRDEPPIPLVGRPGGPEFWRGGSVAFSALQLAHLMEANPIVFVGQDFAFGRGRTHAAGSATGHVFEEGDPPGDYFQVPGANGSPVLTDRIYYSYLLYMQNYLLEFAARKPAVRHINTSTVGAFIRGMDYLDFDRALALNTAQARYSAGEMIAEAVAGSRKIPLKRREAAVCGWVAELDRLLGRIGSTDDFSRTYAAFRSTSVCAQAARSYEDVHYLYETRGGAQGKSSLPARFREHLQFVASELRKSKSAFQPLV